MKTSEHGIALIKAREGFRDHAYPDPGSGGDPWTIGYGSTHGVHKGMVITEEQATAMLAADLHLFEATVMHGVKVALSQDEFDALVSLCYNIGPRAFLGSTVLKRLNAEDRTGAAEAILMWNKAGGKVVQGLVNRREAEQAQFLNGKSDLA